tara:strand:+ start:384 stop:620 length:237 start_codon:yes stop_codon:yes gene_type:complete
MTNLIHSEVKLKIDNFDNSAYQVKEKLKNSKSGLEFKFYQKLSVIFFISCTFLIFPESPTDSEVLCKQNYSEKACIIW